MAIKKGNYWVKTIKYKKLGWTEAKDVNRLDKKLWIIPFTMWAKDCKIDLSYDKSGTPNVDLIIKRNSRVDPEYSVYGENLTISDSTSPYYDWSQTNTASDRDPAITNIENTFNKEISDKIRYGDKIEVLPIMKSSASCFTYSAFRELANQPFSITGDLSLHLEWKDIQSSYMHYFRKNKAISNKLNFFMNAYQNASIGYYNNLGLYKDDSTGSTYIYGFIELKDDLADNEFIYNTNNSTYTDRASECSYIGNNYCNKFRAEKGSVYRIGWIKPTYTSFGNQILFDNILSDIYTLSINTSDIGDSIDYTSTGGTHIPKITINNPNVVPVQADIQAVLGTGVTDTTTITIQPGSNNCYLNAIGSSIYVTGVSVKFKYTDNLSRANRTLQTTNVSKQIIKPFNLGDITETWTASSSALELPVGNLNESAHSAKIDYSITWEDGTIKSGSSYLNNITHGSVSTWTSPFGPADTLSPIAVSSANFTVYVMIGNTVLNVSSTAHYRG